MGASPKTDHVDTYNSTFPLLRQTSTIEVRQANYRTSGLVGEIQTWYRPVQFPTLSFWNKVENVMEKCASFGYLNMLVLHIIDIFGQCCLLFAV